MASHLLCCLSCQHLGDHFDSLILRTQCDPLIHGPLTRRRILQPAVQEVILTVRMQHGRMTERSHGLVTHYNYSGPYLLEAFSHARVTSIKCVDMVVSVPAYVKGPRMIRSCIGLATVYVQRSQMLF